MGISGVAFRPMGIFVTADFTTPFVLTLLDIPGMRWKFWLWQPVLQRLLYTRVCHLSQFKLAHWYYHALPAKNHSSAISLCISLMTTRPRPSKVFPILQYWRSQRPYRPIAVLSQLAWFYRHKFVLYIGKVILSFLLIARHQDNIQCLIKYLIALSMKYVRP